MGTSGGMVVSMGPSWHSNSVSMDDMKAMAHSMVKSGLFGIKNEDQALALMLIAQAHGRHPALVAEDYDVINGRAAMKSHAMLARFQEAGGTIEWQQRDDKCCKAAFTHKNSGTFVVEWTFEMAQRAGLTGKDNYRRHPRQMLSARVISEGVKACFPGCIGAVYTPEEAQFFEAPKEEAPALPKKAAPEAIAFYEEKAEPQESLLTKFCERARNPGDYQVIKDYLMVLGWLKEGQDFQHLSDSHLDRIMVVGDIEKFIAAAHKDATLREKKLQELEQAIQEELEKGKTK